jgi:hypothetical protein
MGYHPPNRYGKVRVFIEGKWQYHGTHRVAFELTNGPIRAGYFVCHHCDNAPCCRPDHLWEGTNSDNLVDAVQKGRHKIPSGVGADHYFHRFPERLMRMSGERSPSAKLTDAQIEDIRTLKGLMTGRAIAHQFGISPSHVCNILKQKTRRRPSPKLSTD